MPSLMPLPRHSGFPVFPGVIQLQHPMPLPKQLIQYTSLICRPLVRSKGFFCLASPRELPSLFPSPACSFSSCAELSQQGCAGRVRGRGFLQCTTVTFMLTAFLARAWWLQHHAGGQCTQVSCSCRHWSCVTHTILQWYYFHCLPFAACIISDVAVH